jgi:excinuclease ABC subunit A
MTVAGAAAYLNALDFSDSERGIAGPVLVELASRLRFLERVDLGYLTLDRLARTLSGGEAQRIELANALGANLADTLYVLDEPTVGLHPRDTSRLVEILDELAARGNTLVVVEHEPLVMKAAAHLVDLGPGAGENGGHVLYAGETGEALRAADTETARYLRGDRSVRRSRMPGEPAEFLVIEGATQHNLKNVTARFPLGRLTAVTGVSGSGKSSLIEDVLHRAAILVFEGTQSEPPGAHRAIRGLDRLDRVVMVDQSPIGRTPRSCPVTYMGGYAPLREIFARQPVAIARGLKDGAFSFNTPGGRCERCEGAGWVTVEMYFLADLLVPCEVCGGDRFRPEVLEVRYRGLNIREALDLTVDQAFEHFATEPRFTRTLHLLKRVGLGYLRLGQPATQLSGGESQRLKVARELAERGAGAALVLLDEPTVGLHYADVQRLVDVLGELVDRGDTVIVIEHNLDVVRCSDWVVDLGPGGGDDGGRLVVEGTPEAVVACAESWTGRFLREPMAAAGPAEFTAAPERPRSVPAAAPGSTKQRARAAKPPARRKRT